jgi:hypothetical protein
LNKYLIYGKQYAVCKIRGRRYVQDKKSGDLKWDNEVDICPDSLYLSITGKKQEDIFPSLKRRAGFLACQQKKLAGWKTRAPFFQ